MIICIKSCNIIITMEHFLRSFTNKQIQKFRCLAEKNWADKVNIHGITHYIAAT